MKARIENYISLEELCRYAAHRIALEARRCVKERGCFTWVLSGGNTPNRLYALMAQPPYSDEMPWERTHVFWGDERCVSPEDPRSNYDAAYRLMIARVPLPQELVHRIPAEKSDARAAARAYEAHLKRFFSERSVITEDFRPSESPEPSLPVFDLLMLGVGVDGHVASLFPDDPALDEEERWVAAVPSPKGSPPVPRVTLTLPVINKARWVMVLISGAGKKKVVSEVLKDPCRADARLPLALVRPEGELIWLVDEGSLT